MTMDAPPPSPPTTTTASPQSPAATSSSIICTGCHAQFPSKNQLFRHLTHSAETCLSPQDYVKYMTQVVSARKNWEKIGVLYGYLVGTDYRCSSIDGASGASIDGVSPCRGVEGGNHAAWMVTQAIDKVSRGIISVGGISSGSGSVVNSSSTTGDDVDAESWTPNAELTSKINRSYGSTARGTNAMEQDPNTGAITEVLCMHAMPLHVNDGATADDEGASSNDDEDLSITAEDNDNNDNDGKKKDLALQKSIQQWVLSVNTELERMISKMITDNKQQQHQHHVSSSSNDESNNNNTDSLVSWSPGKIRVFGRVTISNRKFNAEMDVIHRRVDYCFPADLLYVSKKSQANEGHVNATEKVPISETAVQSEALSLQEFADSMHSFPPGNKPFRVVEPSSSSCQLSSSEASPLEEEVGENNNNNNNTSQYYSISPANNNNIADSSETAAASATSTQRTLRPSIPRPDNASLTYMFALKKLMQRFATKVEVLDTKNESAVMEKEFHDKKRKNQRVPQKKKRVVVGSNNNENSEDVGGGGGGGKEDDSDSKQQQQQNNSNNGKEMSKGTSNGNDGIQQDGGGNDATSERNANDESCSNNAKIPVKRVLRRRRFHNFCPNVLAHDFLAYRRMDRIYHRGTLRLEESNNDANDKQSSTTTSTTTTSSAVSHKTINNRPFVVFSLTGDAFLSEQALRVMGLLIAICRGVIDADILDCIFDEEYTNLVCAPPAPRLGLMAGEATYMTWEGRLKTILSARRCYNYSKGWNNEEVVSSVEKWEESVLRDVARGWYCDGISEDGRLNAEIDWVENVLHPWAQKTRVLLNDYRRWKAAKDISIASASDGTVGSHFLPALDSINQNVPPMFEKVLYYLRQADSSGLWPTTSPKRQLVMLTTSNDESQVKSLAVAHLAAKTNKDVRTSAYAFKEGEGGASGSFSVGVMPDVGCSQPKGNILFPELVKAAFELERALRPDREPSSTIAINRNAQFRPHTDNGAGAGQSNSLIVGLGTYVGGELVVEGTKKDIRYNAIEFDGWKERHWTLPFGGERYSLVWFTPKGCEGMRGIDLDL